MLKKQTVWLLTMLSLVVVLSVYYITSPDGSMNSDVTLMTTEDESSKETVSMNEDENTNQDEKEEPKEETEEMEDGTVISSISNEDLFTAIRMELEDERNKRKQELEAIIGSNEVSAEEKSKAYEEMRELSTIAAKEKVLETLIKSKGYGDALVQADGGKVRITVKAKEHSKKKANEIIHLVRSEISDMQEVAVRFQPVE